MPGAFTVVNALPALTAGVISHNGRWVVADCVRSLANQTGVDARLLLIDVASSDGTADVALAAAPGLEVITCPVNRGPNPARNLAFRHARTNYVLLIDDDAVLAPDCVRELLLAAQRHPDAAAWIPRVLYFDDPGIIQNEGFYLHYVSEAILANRDQPASKGFAHPVQVTGATGICMLVSVEAWRHVGGFDEDYFFGRTDGEFTGRLTLAGYRIYVVPAAACLHKEKKRGFSKLFYQVRNRWYFTLSVYSRRSLLVLGPALLVHEASLILFLALKRQLRPYGRAMWQVLRDLPLILRKRRRIQRVRRVSDRSLLTCGPLAVRADVVGTDTMGRAKRALESFYAAYWAAFARFL